MEKLGIDVEEANEGQVTAQEETGDEPMDLLHDDNIVVETSEEVERVTSFDDLGLKESLLKGVYAYGFDKPSAVQQRAIMPILKGRDVIVQSQSGTGKTGVFCLGALQRIDDDVRKPQVIILSPVRELAE